MLCYLILYAQESNIIIYYRIC